MEKVDYQPRLKKNLKYLFIYYSVRWNHEVSMLNERAPNEGSLLCPSAASQDQDTLLIPPTSKWI